MTVLQLCFTGIPEGQLLHSCSRWACEYLTCVDDMCASRRIVCTGTFLTGSCYGDEFCAINGYAFCTVAFF